MPKLTRTASKRRKKLMDTAMQVQARFNRGWPAAAHSEEIKLKTEALQALSKMRAPAMASMEELLTLIDEVRTVAKLGLSTTGLKFSRVIVG